MLIAVKALRSSEMLAWQAERFGEPLDVLGLKEMEKPVPGPGEVLIKVRAVGLGLPDLMAVQGRYPLITLPPAIPGHSFAGTIDSTGPGSSFRSEEHTSELQSLMRISYAVFCLKKKKQKVPTF